MGRFIVHLQGRPRGSGNRETRAFISGNKGTKVKFWAENFEGEKNKDTTGEQETRKHFYFSVLGTCHLFQGNITPWEGLICSESECCGSLLRFFFVLYATEPNFVPTFYDWFPFSINFSNPYYAGYLMHSLLPNFYPINLQDSIY